MIIGRDNRDDISMMSLNIVEISYDIPHIYNREIYLYDISIISYLLYIRSL